uniref:U2 small nuclear ribonucleoprotein B n=1 Tax=Rhizophora mucronata TaxID=61149 RepID=A0A2P2JIA6_RHIMU
MLGSDAGFDHKREREWFTTLDSHKCYINSSRILLLIVSPIARYQFAYILNSTEP